MRRIPASSSVTLFAFIFALIFPINVKAQYTTYVPWSWQVRPDRELGSDGSCPSSGWILLTFAFVNVLVSVISLFTGHQGVIRFFTCGYLGKDDAKVTWFYMFSLPLALNLGSNALIAYLYKTTPGFGDHFGIWDLTLFYTTRPRLGWILLVIIMNIDFRQSQSKTDGKTNYISSTKAAVAAEFVLQIFSSVYMGKTASFAAKNDYYSLHSTAPNSAEIMYAGALLSLVTVFFTLIFLVYILSTDPGSTSVYLLVTIVSIYSLVASWLFWSGFVILAGQE